MRQRPSSRLLIVNSEGKLLLFKFEHRQGPLAGQSFWATPGGGLDTGETYEQAACRELFDETGLRVSDPGAQVAQRTVVFQMPDGESVTADERFFLFRVSSELKVSKEGWTELERQVTADHRWWSRAELIHTSEWVWPEDLPEILSKRGVWPDDARDSNGCSDRPT
jgi:8-oxo-dGTP pyrophosphatase MutT (NUDIX family)